MPAAAPLCRRHMQVPATLSPRRLTAAAGNSCVRWSAVGAFQDRMLEYDTIMYQLSWRRGGRTSALDLVRRIRNGNNAFGV